MCASCCLNTHARNQMILFSPLMTKQELALNLHLSNDRKSFQQALQNAVACFDDKPSWECLINNGMDMDFSWDNAAQQYSSLFQDIQPNH